jgi:hypothetical protein
MGNSDAVNEQERLLASADASEVVPLVVTQVAGRQLGSGRTSGAEEELEIGVSFGVEGEQPVVLNGAATEAYQTPRGGSACPQLDREVTRVGSPGTAAGTNGRRGDAGDVGDTTRFAAIAGERVAVVAGFTE